MPLLTALNKKIAFSAFAIAFFTICFFSIYATIVTLLVLKKGGVVDLANSHHTAYFPTAVKTGLIPGANSTTIPVAKRNGANYDPLADRPVYFNSGEQKSPLPVIMNTIRTRFPSFLLNGSIASNNNNNGGVEAFDNITTLEREQMRVLEVLVDHYSKTEQGIDSDVVELRHCRLDMIDYHMFSSWASIILQDAWPTIERKLKRNTGEVKGIRNRDNWDKNMYREFCFGLLEIFATHSIGRYNHTICDFEKYSLKIERGDLLSAELKLRSVSPSSNNLPRLVFVIIAFQDAGHLEALIDACIMPQHLIIVHLEQRSPSSFVKSVHRIAKKYENVAVVQFGSIIYRTDSVSTVNYQIMNWLTEELKVPYDYWLTLGNAAYPLLGAEELTKHFLNTKRNIWLGELKQNYGEGANWGYLERKRLIFTTGDQKYTQRTKKWKQNDFTPLIPDNIKTNMTKKTNSGNQAVFSQKVVKKLVASPEVKELLSIAKYGCCCCLEERTWIAAARMIGYGEEAMEAASMFQVWGGEPKCGDGSMKNALLKPNASICFKSQDLTQGNIFERHRTDSQNTGDPDFFFFRGDKLLDELRLAKERGFLFARKFNSRDRDSLELIEMIKKNLHND